MLGYRRGARVGALGLVLMMPVACSDDASLGNDDAEGVTNDAASNGDGSSNASSATSDGSAATSSATGDGSSVSGSATSSGGGSGFGASSTSDTSNVVGSASTSDGSGGSVGSGGDASSTDGVEGTGTGGSPATGGSGTGGSPATGGSGAGGDASGGAATTGGDCEENNLCIRPYECALSCSAEPDYVGCCPCAQGLIDQFVECVEVACGDTTCARDEYCVKSVGQCDASNDTGSCAARPELCTLEYDPVCGCDGETYGNDCAAAAAGVNIASTGACDGDA